MRTDKKRFSTRLAAVVMAGTLAVGMMGMSVFAEDVQTGSPITSVTVKKTVLTDGNTYAPNTTFKFTVENGLEGTYGNDKVKAGTEGGLYFTKNEQGEKSYEGSIAFAPSGETPTGKYEKTTKLNTDVSVFQETGIYHYTLKETDSQYNGISYDTANRDVYVYVYENAQKERFIGSVVMVYTNKNNEVVKNEDFTNDYGENNNTTHDITVKKQVTGNMGEHDKLFKFKVSVAGDSGEWYKVLVKETENSPAVENHIVSGEGGVEYSIKDTGSIQIFGLTSNDKYNVEEDDYSQSGYVTTVGSDVKRKVEGTVSADGTQVTITNKKEASTPTGIILNYGPYILMIALAGSMAVFFFRRKNHKEA